jgi:glyoxylase-like metal-dependent hydrolase (beta-lactamase superfamily II)
LDLAATDFFITHLHADHIGLISAFATASSTVYFNRADARINQAFVDDPEGVFAWLIDGARSAGFPEAEIQNALLKHPGFKYSPPEFPPFTFLEDGARVRVGIYSFEVVSTPGHTPGHQCLYEPEHGLLFSGDHILGDITPNITVWAEDDDALGQYLASLDRVRRLDVELVLPGHRSVVTDCRGRIVELERHHRHRLDEITSILASGPRNAYETASRMTWDIVASSWTDFPVVQKWFAVSEASSHLRHLVSRKIVAGTSVEGVIHYALNGTG